jgi:anti-sigma-K factor RskA
MLDEDQDTLAAEYVLGTLSAEEREHAEALLTFDPGFESAVRQWERRLGELNVMVEAVEPPTELWHRIKKDVTPAEPAAVTEASGVAHDLDTPLAVEAGSPRHLDEPLTVSGLTTDFSSSEPAPSDETLAVPPEDTSTTPPVVESQKTERSADVIYLAKRVRRWRRLTLAIGAIAALLAIYIAAWQVAPDLIPAQLRPAGSGMIARSDGSVRMQQDRLVAVLQQQPTAPAFIVTLDTQQRTLVVRRVSATPEAGKSYELWLISSRLGAPRSLGVVGSEEFTQRPLPGNFDVDTLRTASYAVSLEPTGGSRSGAPTGPVLFTGKAVESLPASQPSKPART